MSNAVTVSKAYTDARVTTLQNELAAMRASMEHEEHRKGRVRLCWHVALIIASVLIPVVLFYWEASALWVMITPVMPNVMIEIIDWVKLL